jgi:hypothetical protein
VRTSGAGSDGTFVLLGAAVLVLAGMAVMGGPHNFFQAANRLLMDSAEKAVLWVQASW